MMYLSSLFCNDKCQCQESVLATSKSTFNNAHIDIRRLLLHIICHIIDDHFLQVPPQTTVSGLNTIGIFIGWLIQHRWGPILPTDCQNSLQAVARSIERVFLADLLVDGDEVYTSVDYLRFYLEVYWMPYRLQHPQQNGPKLVAFLMHAFRDWVHHPSTVGRLFDSALDVIYIWLTHGVVDDPNRDLKSGEFSTYTDFCEVEVLRELGVVFLPQYRECRRDMVLSAARFIRNLLLRLRNLKGRGRPPIADFSTIMDYLHRPDNQSNLWSIMLLYEDPADDIYISFNEYSDEAVRILGEINPSPVYWSGIFQGLAVLLRRRHETFHYGSRSRYLQLYSLLQDMRQHTTASDDGIVEYVGGHDLALVP
jgi:hypothetical protein